LICSYDNAISVKYVNKKNQRSIWVIQKNIEDVEKWVPKKEELVKEIKENQKGEDVFVIKANPLCEI